EEGVRLVLEAVGVDLDGLHVPVVAGPEEPAAALEELQDDLRDGGPAGDVHVADVERVVLPGGFPGTVQGRTERTPVVEDELGHQLAVVAQVVLARHELEPNRVHCRSPWIRSPESPLPTTSRRRTEPNRRRDIFPARPARPAGVAG